MLKEEYKNEIEVIYRKGNLTFPKTPTTLSTEDCNNVIIKLPDGKVLKHKKSLINFIEDGLNNIFIDMTSSSTGELLVCQLQNEKCYIIYRIGITMEELYIQSNLEIIKDLKPIYEDGNKQLVAYLSIMLKQLRQFLIIEK